MTGRPLDAFLAAGDGHPDRRVRLLHRSWPDGDVLVRPELALVGEDFLRPRAVDDLPGFLEANARLAQADLVDVVLAGDAAREAGDDAAVGQAVLHGQLLGQPQGIVQRQQVAVDEKLHPLRPLSGGGGEQVGGVHEPVRRSVVLVEPHAVVPQPFQRVPGRQVLGVRTHRHIGLEVALGQRPWQLLAILQMIEVLPVGQKIEDEHVHTRVPHLSVG